MKVLDFLKRVCEPISQYFLIECIFAIVLILTCLGLYIFRFVFI